MDVVIMRDSGVWAQCAVSECLWLHHCRSRNAHVADDNYMYARRKALASSREAERARASAEAAEETDEEQRTKHDVEVDGKILERLSTIKGLVSRLRG